MEVILSAGLDFLRILRFRFHKNDGKHSALGIQGLHVPETSGRHLQRQEQEVRNTDTIFRDRLGLNCDMSSNVGLTTPRGSGTSGYVQRNLSHLKPRDNFAPYPKDDDLQKHRQRKPDKDILNHDRLREIEVKVFDLRDKLEDEGYAIPSLADVQKVDTCRWITNTFLDCSVDEEEIETQTEALRKDLLTGSAAAEKATGRSQLKPHQVHELAAAKIEESEKLRRALGIREDYEEGSHWKKQEERMHDGTKPRIKET